MDNPVELGMTPEEMEAEARLSEMRVEALQQETTETLVTGETPVQDGGKTEETTETLVTEETLAHISRS